MTRQIGCGDPAPDFSYTQANGVRRRLSEAWRDSPAVVVWLRHFG